MAAAEYRERADVLGIKAGYAESFSEEICQGRIHKGLTVRKAARLLGIDRGSLARMEQQEIQPISKLLLVKVSRLYGLNYLELRGMFSNGCDE